MIRNVENMRRFWNSPGEHLSQSKSWPHMLHPPNGPPTRQFSQNLADLPQTQVMTWLRVSAQAEHDLQRFDPACNASKSFQADALQSPHAPEEAEHPGHRHGPLGDSSSA